MMANPRKFSEKIALHNQKQAEETAAFEQIMKEVMGATRQRPDSSPMGAYHKHLHITQSLGSYRGGSLPNVNQIGNNSIDLQSALNSLEDMKQGRESLADRIHRERGRHSTPHQSRRFPFEKRVDVSPYSSSYLSPPPDTNWRRTNSDSALHQSAMNPQENFHGANTPPNQRRLLDVDGNMLAENEQVKNYWDPKKQQLVPLTQSRPKSCEVPGINIYPSQEDTGAVHVPISSNTGSLPDLTNLHFPSPLATPLDVEDQAGTVTTGTSFNQTSHSSSSTLSPSSLTPQQHHTHVLGPSVSGGTLITNAGVGGGGGSRHSSPGPSPSPSSRRRHHHNLTNLVIGSGSPRHHGHQHAAQQQGLTVDTNALSLETYPQPQPQFGVYPQQQQKTTQSFVYEPTTPTSPTMPQLPMGSYRSTSPADHSCSAPTSPVSHSLSPASSPGLGPNASLSKSPFTDTNYYIQHQQQTNALQHQLEQFKMMTENNTACTSSSNVGSHNNTAMFLATVDSGGGCGPPGDGDIGGVVGRGGLNFANQLPSGINTAQDMDNAMYYSISSLGSDPHLQSPTLYSKSVIASSHQTTPQTPQTPTSIPDIILTGTCWGNEMQRQMRNYQSFNCSQMPIGEHPRVPVCQLRGRRGTTPGADEPIMRQDFAKDLGSAMASMSGSFDSDFFAPDEALRGGLDPIDFDGLQILTDPDIPVISDPSAEEAFHLERS